MWSTVDVPFFETRFRGETTFIRFLVVGEKTVIRGRVDYGIFKSQFPASALDLAGRHIMILRPRRIICPLQLMNVLEQTQRCLDAKMRISAELSRSYHQYSCSPSTLASPFLTE
jgi:hypothetical protein